MVHECRCLHQYSHTTNIAYVCSNFKNKINDIPIGSKIQSETQESKVTDNYQAKCRVRNLTSKKNSHHYKGFFKITKKLIVSYHEDPLSAKQ
jgi:hypothetical protein